MAGRDTRAGGQLHRLAAVLGRLGRASWLVVRGFVADRGYEQAGALAYFTLLSLVPFLATLGALYRSFFSVHTEDIVRTITMVLPYSSQTVADTLAEFVDRAAAVGGIGSLVFVLVVFRLFFIVEATINEVWGVIARRSLMVRVFSFTMVLFWGPVVVGLGATGLYWLKSRLLLPGTMPVLTLGRFLLSLGALTMMYWLVPNTSVRLRNAFVGSLAATAGLQLLRSAFLAYLKAFPNINFIFGSLGLALIFLIALFAFWSLVLLGAQTSYVAQNLRVLLKSSETIEGPQPDPEVTAMALLARCYRAAAVGDTPPSVEELAAGLGITHRYGERLLERLVRGGLLAVTGEDRELYVPARTAGTMTVAKALQLFRGDGEGALPDARGVTLERLFGLFARAGERQREVLQEATFEELVMAEEDG